MKDDKKLECLEGSICTRDLMADDKSRVQWSKTSYRYAQ